MPKRAYLEIDRDQEDGNTIPPPDLLNLSKAQSLQLKDWCFTWNHYPEKWIEILETTFRQIAVKFRAQTEIGDSGTPHIQGCLTLKKRQRWSEFKLPAQIHWEKTRNVPASYDYCNKPQQIENYSKLEWGHPVPLKLITELNTRQQEIIDVIKSEPNDRTIVWICDKTGNQGKTCLMKYCVINHNALVCGSGKGSDAINFIYNADMDKCRVVFFAFPRTVEGYVSYAALETIKDGMISNTKYETGMKVYNSPHVIVMANFEPDITKLSADRWDIRFW